MLGFYRVASSFLTELERRHAALVEQVFVVDFNPTVYHSLQARGVKVHYGDIAHADTLAHAGIADAEIVISSVPDSLLKGTSNERLVRTSARSIRRPRSSPPPTCSRKRRRSTPPAPTT